MRESYAPTRKDFKAMLSSIPTRYGEIVAHTAVLEGFEQMIDNTIERAKNQGRAEGWDEAVDYVQTTIENIDLITADYCYEDNPYRRYLDV